MSGKRRNSTRPNHELVCARPFERLNTARVQRRVETRSFLRIILRFTALPHAYLRPHRPSRVRRVVRAYTRTKAARAAFASLVNTTRTLQARQSRRPNLIRNERERAFAFAGESGDGARSTSRACCRAPLGPAGSPQALTSVPVSQTFFRHFIRDRRAAFSNNVLV